MNKSQQSLIRLGDRAKTRIITDIDYVNASGNLNFSRHQVHHLKRLVKQVRRLDGVESGGTDTDQLLHYFESMEDCRYTILYNNSINLAGSDDSNLLTNYLCDSCVGSEVYSSTVQYTPDELSQIKEFCITQRNAIECQGQYKMVLGTAWTLKLLRSLGISYGEVVYVDATEGTNEEERPLLTFRYEQVSHNIESSVAK